jgi:hypothetical protein
VPTNQLKNAQTSAQFFEEMNAHLENEFIAYGEPGGAGIKLLTPGKVAALRGRAVEDLATAEAAEVVHLTKAQLLTTALSSGMNAELNVVNKNGNYETLVWTTTPANIKKALRAGVFASKTIQNRLTKAVAHLGLYKQLMFSRSVEEGFVVKHNNEKLAIVDFTQDCIEALQP